MELLKIELKDARDVELVREALLSMHSVATREYSAALQPPVIADRLVRIKDDVDRLERMLAVTGWTSGGPRRWEEQGDGR
jgi:hypothetical protein